MAEHGQSRFRIEKRRATADIVLANGTAVRGCFFLWLGGPSHHERIGDLLNEPSAFFPFQLEDGRTVLYNRTHVAFVRLPSDGRETQLESGYEVATRHGVELLLTTGERFTGTVSAFLPAEHDRLSDYVRSGRPFRYLETDTHTMIINLAHVVEVIETRNS